VEASPAGQLRLAHAGLRLRNKLPTLTDGFASGFPFRWFLPLYLLFSISLLLLYLLIDDRAPGTVIAVWCLFPFLFYFSSTATPRYFLLTAFPLTVLTVVGAFDLTRALAQTWRPGLVRMAVVGALTLHLFIGLGHFAGDRVVNPFLGPSFRTHDGPFPTGALLYFTYNPGSELLKDLMPPSQFGVGNSDHEGYQGEGKGSAGQCGVQSFGGDPMDRFQARG